MDYELYTTYSEISKHTVEVFSTTDQRQCIIIRKIKIV